MASKRQSQARRSQARPSQARPSQARGSHHHEHSHHHHHAKVREHSLELITAFAPIRTFLLIIGQMPFELRAKDDGTYSFRFNWKGAITMVYFLMYILLTVNFLIVTLGIFTFVVSKSIFSMESMIEKYLDDPTKPGQYIKVNVTWEREVVRVELAPCVVVWTWLLIAVVGSTTILLNGKKYAHYFNYWNRQVQIMDMNVTKGVRKYVILENIFCVIVIVVLACVLYIPDFDVFSETSAALANFFFRCFGVDVGSSQSNKDEEVIWIAYRAFGFLILTIAYTAARANIIQFMFFARLLTNACEIWNQRFKNVMKNELSGEKEDDETFKRLDLQLLLKDHFVIVQLFKMTENFFSRVLLFYYSLQTMSVVLELYQLTTLRPRARQWAVPTSLQNEPWNNNVKPTGIVSILNEDKENSEWRKTWQSTIIILMLLAQNIIFTVLTTRTAAKAYEEAMTAFQILRRIGYLGAENKRKRNFVHSLVISFARNNPMEINLGGYYSVNKSLLPALLGGVAGYYVATYALSPDTGELWEHNITVAASKLN